MNWGGQLLSNIAGVALPTYYSLIAIETKGSADDTRMLTYWVVYGFMTVIEYWSNTLLYWVPFYFLLKTVFLLWLVLPQFGGAELVYHKAMYVQTMSLADHSRPATLKYTQQSSSPAAGVKPHSI